MATITTTYAERYVDEANAWEQGHVEDDGCHFEPCDKPGWSKVLTAGYDPDDGVRWRFAFDDGSYLEMDADGEWGAGNLSEFGYGEEEGE